MEHWTYEDLFTKWSLESLAELLDAPHDLYDLGYTDLETQKRVVLLSEQLFTTIMCLHRYYNGTSNDKLNYEHLLHWIQEQEEQLK